MSDSKPTPFRLDFRVRGGEIYDRLPAPFDTQVEVAEYGTWLRVRSDDKLAMLVITRHNGDLVERPVGLFRMRLDARMLGDILAAVERTPWPKLPVPERGDITASMLTIDYRRGGLVIRREFNARSRTFIAAIWPLMETLHALMGALQARPAGVLAVSVASSIDPANPRARVLELYLANPGQWPIVITDPRVDAARHAPHARARLLVAPAPVERPGMMAVPPRFVDVALGPLPEGAPRLIGLQGGGVQRFAVGWSAPAPGNYVMQGVWFDYGGPIAAVDDPLAMMPLAGDDEPPAHGAIYPVRGAAFSAYTSFVVEPPRS